MLKAFKQIFSPAPYAAEAHRLYLALVNQARQPEFYRDYQVADTVDGRFDVLALHLFLVQYGLRAVGTSQALEIARSLAELFFADMDRSLREMGAGDTGVGIRVKNMAQALYGRVQIYENSLESTAAMEEALARNLYRGAEVAGNSLTAVAQYVQKNAVAFAAPEAGAQLVAGKAEFRF